MEVLLEYKGSKRVIKCANSELCDRVRIELNALGNPNARVYLAGDQSVAQPSSRNDLILQRFVGKWNSFVDVQNIDSVCSGDRLTVIPNPFATASPKVYAYNAKYATIE